MTPEQKELLTCWSVALSQLTNAKAVVERELMLRKQMMASFFPAPVEGVNSTELEDGWVLKATYEIDRKIDEATIATVCASLRKMNVNPDPLIRFKPELALTAYKALTQVNPIAAKVFDECMTSKPASPVLELRPPKETK